MRDSTLCSCASGWGRYYSLKGELNLQSLGFDWGEEKISRSSMIYSPFHTTALIPGEYDPGEAPGVFTPRLPQHSFTLSPRKPARAFPRSRGSACTFHTMIRNPRQPRCIFITEVMNVASRKRAIPLCNVCTYSHWIVKNKQNGYAWHERRCR